MRQLTIPENGTVGFKIQSLGQKINLLGKHRRIGGDALGGNVNKRNDAGQRKQENNEGDHEIAGADALYTPEQGAFLFRGNRSHVALLLPYSRPSSPRALEALSEASTSSSPTRD